MQLFQQQKLLYMEKCLNISPDDIKANTSTINNLITRVNTNSTSINNLTTHANNINNVAQNAYNTAVTANTNANKIRCSHTYSTPSTYFDIMCTDGVYDWIIRFWSSGNIQWFWKDCKATSYTDSQTMNNK